MTSTTQDIEHSPWSSKAMLIQMAYVSTETKPLTTDEKLLLLKNAQEKNSGLEITGMLLHRHDSFFQVLEGNQTAVQNLFSEISEDPRHVRVEKLFEQVIESREFPNWSMNFRELDDKELEQIPEVASALPAELKSDKLFRDLPKVRQLLQAFHAMP